MKINVLRKMMFMAVSSKLSFLIKLVHIPIIIQSFNSA